ncbi:hypothetical protein ACQ4PT_051651 [Festuca glaucescens]
MGAAGSYSHLHCEHGIDNIHLAASLCSYYHRNCLGQDSTARNNSTTTSFASTRGCGVPLSRESAGASRQGPGASDPRRPRGDGERVHSEIAAPKGDFSGWARGVQPFLPRSGLGDQPGRGLPVVDSQSLRTKEGDEYVVPEGHTVASPLVIHNRLPHVYKDPQRYEPDRFVPGRGEDGAGGAFSYTAFGGGRHACVGEAFAYMQMKVIWSHLLRNFDMEMLSPFPETDWNVVMPGPMGKVMVSYKRRTMSAPP